MLTGPKRAISGPNEPPRLKPGHRGQLARLIRERPVFVKSGRLGHDPEKWNRLLGKIMPKQKGKDKATGRIQQG
jgi:hypothetical protein